MDSHRPQIFEDFDEKLQGFIEFVLAQYINEGVGELDLEKLPQLYGPADYPCLEAQRRKCEALAPFAAAPYSAAEARATGWRPENRTD